MSFKTLHSFTINLDKQVEETTTREEGGQKITTTSTVTKSVPYTILLKDPSRREKQDLSLFQGIIYNEAISKGLLPRVIMQQKIVRDTATTPISGDEDKNVAAMNVRLQELANDYIRINANSTPDTPEVKKDKEKLLLEYMLLQKKVTDINTAYQSVFAYTAENYMQTKTLSWLTLFLTYIKTGDGKQDPMFTGNDFAAKEDKSGDMEDAVDPLFVEVMKKLPTYWMLYLFGRANKPEDFIRIEEEWAKQLEAEKKMKEEEEKAAAEAAKALIPQVDTVAVVDTVPSSTTPEAEVLPLAEAARMGTE